MARKGKPYIVTHECNGRTFDIIIGKNAIDNWRIIREADGDDMWIHAKDMPSAHVIIKEHLMKGIVNTLYPEEILRIAGEYCKTYSNIQKKIKIDYTLVKNVTIGKMAGQVSLKDVLFIVV
jgi:predicted ribosome quality control (RQC) complex YloA/Tae2 family protein